MDFTKLLKHCEAEHGIQVDKSAFTEAILNSIFAFFAAHGEILTHTQLWDIFETLQERPKPGNPQPIVALMKGRAEENIKCGEPMESASWYSQEGVLLSTADALKIVEFCEGVHVVERLPDYGTGFRPPWDLIGPEYVACAVDRRGIIYFYNKIPKAYESNGTAVILMTTPFIVPIIHLRSNPPSKTGANAFGLDPDTGKRRARNEPDRNHFVRPRFINERRRFFGVALLSDQDRAAASTKAPLHTAQCYPRF